MVYLTVFFYEYEQFRFCILRLFVMMNIANNKSIDVLVAIYTNTSSEISELLMIIIFCIIYSFYLR